MRSLIVGTAGHIDHGKSALVRALTGTDPDRLPEEKKRGITIDLGFADLTLDELRLGFVDVPGHERFIKNMLAGAHGIDVLALIIAADEGVMPQTREHFDICRLLGVTEGLIVITKMDLVDDEMLMLVEDEAKDLVAGSFLAHAPIVAVSSRTGEGLDQLRAKLKEAARRATPRNSDFTMRLPVDRAFSMKGFGAVVTGTLISGNITEADELELLPQGLPVRVRGTQVHGKTVARAEAGQRTAVNLAGVDVADIQRGMVLAPARRLRSTQIIDVSFTVLPDVSREVRSRARVRVHLGAAEVLGRVTILEEGSEIARGKTGLVQLRMESPVVALHGDRFIIRSYSPPETLGGGIVLDPFASKHRSKELPEIRRRLNQLAKPDKQAKLSAFIEASGERGIRPADVMAATGWKSEVFEDTLRTASKSGTLINAGGVLIGREGFNHLCRAVIAELEQYHRREPLARGMLRETIRGSVFAHSLPELFGAVVNKLELDGKLLSEKETVRLREHRIDLSSEELDLQKRMEALYLKASLEAPPVEEIIEQAGIPKNQQAQGRKILQLLIDSGRLVRIQTEMFVHVRAIEELKRKLLDYAAQHGSDRFIDVAAFKDLARVSRKYAIPLLEFFDRERITRRAGDKRLIL